MSNGTACNYHRLGRRKTPRTPELSRVAGILFPQGAVRIFVCIIIDEQ